MCRSDCCGKAWRARNRSQHKYPKTVVIKIRDNRTESVSPVGFSHPGFSETSVKVPLPLF
ncbi:MAG: hypothetical protein HC846_06740 [Blastocatellia bacterium]|nr:hypothetical protein [Blastocatellia bacterium]